MNVFNGSSVMIEPSFHNTWYFSTQVLVRYKNVCVYFVNFADFVCVSWLWTSLWSKAIYTAWWGFTSAQEQRGSNLWPCNRRKGPCAELKGYCLKTREHFHTRKLSRWFTSAPAKSSFCLKEIFERLERIFAVGGKREVFYCLGIFRTFSSWMCVTVF